MRGPLPCPRGPAAGPALTSGRSAPARPRLPTSAPRAAHARGWERRGGRGGWCLQRPLPAASGRWRRCCGGGGGARHGRPCEGSVRGSGLPLWWLWGLRALCCCTKQPLGTASPCPVCQHCTLARQAAPLHAPHHFRQLLRGAVCPPLRAALAAVTSPSVAFPQGSVLSLSSFLTAGS